MELLVALVVSAAWAAYATVRQSKGDVVTPAVLFFVLLAVGVWLHK